MNRHAPRQPLLHPKKRVQPIGEEMDQRRVSQTNTINVVSPIDHQATPNHEKQQREADPVKPADRERMLLLEVVHRNVLLPFSILPCALTKNLHLSIFFAPLGIVDPLCMMDIFFSIGILSNASAFSFADILPIVSIRSVDDI